MWQRGRRLFTVAALLMLLTAVIHTIGGLGMKPGNETEARLFADMESNRAPAGLGMSPSLWGVFRAVFFMMGLLFAAIGTLNLAVAASADSSDPLLWRLGWINLLWVSTLTAMSWFYQIPPPLISGIVIEVFVIAYLASRAKSGPATARNKT